MRQITLDFQSHVKILSFILSERGYYCWRVMRNIVKSIFNSISLSHIHTTPGRLGENSKKNSVQPIALIHVTEDDGLGRSRVNGVVRNC